MTDTIKADPTITTPSLKLYQQKANINRTAIYHVAITMYVYKPFQTFL